MSGGSKLSRGESKVNHSKFFPMFTASCIIEKEDLNILIRFSADTSANNKVCGLVVEKLIVQEQ